MSVRELGGRWARQLQSFTQYLFSHLGIIWALTSLGHLLHPHMVLNTFLLWATISPSLCRLLPWNRSMPQELSMHFSRYESEQRMETCTYSSIYIIVQCLCIAQALIFTSCYSLSCSFSWGLLCRKWSPLTKVESSIMIWTLSWWRQLGSIIAWQHLTIHRWFLLNHYKYLQECLYQ